MFHMLHTFEVTAFKRNTVHSSQVAGMFRMLCTFEITAFTVRSSLVGGVFLFEIECFVG